MTETSTPDTNEQSTFWISPDQQPETTVAASIVIPVYNAASTLSRALRSVLGQTRTDIEVILVDDGSTDSSWDLITDWIGRDPRIRGLHHTITAGKSIALNHAISFARGKWLTVLYADDWFHPARLTTLLNEAERHDVDMIADNQFFYDAGANVVVGNAWRAAPATWQLSFDDFLRGANPYDAFNLGMLKPVIKTEFLLKSGLVYEALTRQGEDFLFLLQFYLLGGKALVSDAPGYYYTQPFGSISQSWSPGARRDYDFQAAFEINQMYLKLAEPKITPFQLHHLKARNRRLKALENYYAAKELFVQGNVIAAAQRVVEHPATLAYATRRLLVRYGGLPTSLATALAAARSRRTGTLLKASGT